jgi:hypothetical protein
MLIFNVSETRTLKDFFRALFQARVVVEIGVLSHAKAGLSLF